MAVLAGLGETLENPWPPLAMRPCLGLCCFYAQQYDMSLTCFERALSLAADDAAADVWYNVSHIAVAIGDLALAYQCLRSSPS
jgi:tetratricopeptide (TPR) repeat protein